MKSFLLLSISLFMSAMAVASTQPMDASELAGTFIDPKSGFHFDFDAFDHGVRGNGKPETASQQVIAFLAVEHSRRIF